MTSNKFKTTLIAGLLGAMSLGLSGTAFAQRHDDRRDDHRDDRYEHRDDHGRRGAGPNHEFYVGHRMPAQYRTHQYVVDDWRGHHLRQPPRGYHWVQSGSDYLLVAVATGLIANAILNN